MNEAMTDEYVISTIVNALGMISCVVVVGPSALVLEYVRLRSTD